MNTKITGGCIALFVISFLIVINLYQDHELDQAMMQQYKDIKLQQETRDAVFANPVRPIEDVKNP